MLQTRLRNVASGLHTRVRPFVNYVRSSLKDTDIKQNFTKYVKSNFKNNFYVLVNDSKNFKVISEHKPEEILKKHTWIMRLLKGDLKIFGLMHHGLVTQIGGAEIVNYDGEEANPTDAAVRKTDATKFIRDDQDNIFFTINVKDEHKKNEEEIDKLIEQKLGEKKYNIVTNNCEIFVRDILIKDEFKQLYQHQAGAVMNKIIGAATGTYNSGTRVINNVSDRVGYSDRLLEEIIFTPGADLYYDITCYRYDKQSNKLLCLNPSC
jgi:hypothetical protein